MTIVRRLSPLGDMMFGQGLANFATRAEACAQDVRTRLILIRAEWFLDEGVGTPYLEEIFLDQVQLATVEAAIKKVILETVDVSAITVFSLDLDRNTRACTIAATVTTIYDETINIQVVI